MDRVRALSGTVALVAALLGAPLLTGTAAAAELACSDFASQARPSAPTTPAARRSGR